MTSHSDEYANIVEETNEKSSNQKMEDLTDEGVEAEVNENNCYTIDTSTSACNHVWVVRSHPTLPCSIVQCDECGIENK